jgi:hypothetical protein
MEPGEIYLADIVVSREELNRGHCARVVVCTSARFSVRRQAGELRAIPCRLEAAQRLMRSIIFGGE